MEDHKRTLWQCTDSVCVCVAVVHCWDLLRVSSSVEHDLLSVLSYLRFS